ncbi:hypothetical protein SAMN05192588_1506 [Nonlabens sp. Hel1_33_55]|uniref:hypothetical protein n=1 Tax=Nonlabens sp. Hel1_33_55 TaxID=1336802 RepID=UPI000875C794|nr:hypothetical protein [Nonlabens sp. Hel1_33_55]SCY17459.1 hypothetical protein SAMN05192588_1506 [Nonlabens sp. Hel1_33_55]
MSTKATSLLKKQVHDHCLALVKEQLDTIQSSLDQLMEAKTNETKSSAGDKYETGMAMIQNQEQLYKRQQVDAKNRWNVLNSIDPTKEKTTVDTGTLIQLSTGWFYMAVAIGKVTMEEQDVFVLSLQSPLGVLLKGKTAKDQINFNGKQITVESVL